MTATIVSKLRTVFPHYSPKMRAIVECLCSMEPTVSPYFGEGYSKNDGPRSMLGRVLAAAEEYARLINESEGEKSQ